jgi:tetratricopeptide (TPR) repeat protein
MTRRTLCLLVILTASLPMAGASSMTQSWQMVQQVLAEPDAEELEARVTELRDVAEEVQAYRLTPFATAMVAWAQDNPGELGEMALELARSLDPGLPAADFLSARWSWEQGDYFDASTSYIGGWVSLVSNDLSRRALLVSGGVWLLLACGCAFFAVVVVTTLLHIRQLAHDAVELGMLLFQRSNALVFGTVVLVFPLFAALGPLWMVCYLFALSWFYMSRKYLVLAVIACCGLAVLMPALDAWQDLAIATRPVTDRVVQMLETRRIDPSTLREFGDLEPDLGGMGSYNVILGELYRLHGDREEALIRFQRAALSESRDTAGLILLGNLAMEAGDVSRAVQHYTEALEINPSSALAHYNLSFAYDQLRRFNEGDQEREQAQRLSEGQIDELGIGGVGSRTRYPRIGRPEVERMLARLPADNRLSATLQGFRLRPLREFLSAFSIAFWASGLLGVGLLVARSRWMWKASTCTRCGKVFCPRCKTATESASYCSQCISVFLKRDVVAIDQQAAKQRQIRRWERWTTLFRRLANFFMPGSSSLIEGRVVRGFLMSLVSWLFLIGVVLWLPRFLTGVEPLAAVLPAQVVLGLCFLILWVRSNLLAWSRR